MAIRFLGILVLLFVVSCSTVHETPRLSRADDPERVVWDGYFLDLHYKFSLYRLFYSSVAKYRNVLLSELTGLPEMDNALKECDAETDLFEKVINFQYQKVKPELEQDSVQFKGLVALFNQPKLKNFLSVRRDLFDSGALQWQSAQEYQNQQNELSEVLESQELRQWRQGLNTIFTAMNTIKNRNLTRDSVNVFFQEQIQDAYESSRCQSLFSFLGE